MKNNNDFWNTIQKVKDITSKHMNSKQKKHYKQEIVDQKKKGQKMPLNMLKGIRQKIKDQYK